VGVNTGGSAVAGRQWTFLSACAPRIVNGKFDGVDLSRGICESAQHAWIGKAKD
jgi:hypothetical protein